MGAWFELRADLQRYPRRPWIREQSVGADGVRIGSDCTLRQAVTIGNRAADGPVPVLGDGVDLGAYAQVLGGVTLGDGCRVGALSVVVHGVSPGATAVGTPARVPPDRRALDDEPDRGL
jgi:serine O-acetyltransferase